MRGGATFDETGRYRYALWRAWDPAAPDIAFVMLNPNRADAICDDPTIRRCVGFARAWGFGRLWVVNLFGYRARDPRDLRAVADPIGSDNDRHLVRAARRAAMVIAAWGNAGTFGGRDREVIELLREGDRTIHCLGVTRCGCPRHPLYLAQTVAPQPAISL
jgi:hypothetical protein